MSDETFTGQKPEGRQTHFVRNHLPNENQMDDMSNPTELLPCPFCQSSAVAVKSNEDDDTFWVECDSCETKGPASYERQDGTNATTNHKEFAAELWNHRTPAAPPIAEDAGTILKAHIVAATKEHWDDVNWNDVRVLGAILDAMQSYARAHAAKAVEHTRKVIVSDAVKAAVSDERQRLVRLVDEALKYEDLSSDGLRVVRQWLTGDVGEKR